VKGCFYFLQGQTQKSRKKKEREEKTKKVTWAKQRQFGTRAVPGWKESQEKSNVALESNAWPLQDISCVTQKDISLANTCSSQASHLLYIYIYIPSKNYIITKEPIMKRSKDHETKAIKILTLKANVSFNCLEKNINKKMIKPLDSSLETLL